MKLAEMQQRVQEIEDLALERDRLQEFLDASGKTTISLFNEESGAMDFNGVDVPQVIEAFRNVVKANIVKLEARIAQLEAD